MNNFKNYPEIEDNNFMSSNPLVSIITPAYNQERFIGDCIESVLNQTYPNWEMLIVDDASYDKTGEIIQKYVKEDNRIKHLRHRENYGIYKLSESYNEALNIAKGEYIAILEGDDLWPEDKLMKQLPLFEGDRAGVVLTWGRGVWINEEGKPLGLVPFPKIGEKSKNIYENSPVGAVLNKLLLANFIIPAVAVMIRKNFLLAINGFQQLESTHFTDYLTWLELSLQGEFRFSHHILGFWRVHNQQITSKFSHKMFSDTAKISTQFLDKLKNHQEGACFCDEKTINANNNWLIAQSRLASKNYTEARKYLGEMLLNGPFLFKIKAILGSIASLLHTDLTIVDKLYRIKSKICFLISNRIIG